MSTERPLYTLLDAAPVRFIPTPPFHTPRAAPLRTGRHRGPDGAGLIFME